MWRSSLFCLCAEQIITSVLLSEQMSASVLHLQVKMRCSCVTASYVLIVSLSCGVSSVFPSFALSLSDGYVSDENGGSVK